MRALVLMGVITAFAGAWVTAAVAQSPPSGRADPQAGQRLALRVCDACHIVASNQEMRPLVSRYAPSFFDVANRPNTTAPSLRAFLAHPHPLGNMPYPELSAAQIADVSLYILSLRGRH